MFLEGDTKSREPSGDHFTFIALKAAPARVLNRMRIVTSSPTDRLVSRAGILFYGFLAEYTYIIWVIHFACFLFYLSNSIIELTPEFSE